MTEGGKSLAGRQRQGETLEHKETVSKHDESQVAMQAIPTSPLEVIEAAFLLGIFVKLLDHPACMGQQNEALQRGIFGQDAEPVFDLLFFLLLRLSRSWLRVISCSFRHRAFGQQPAFGSGVDTTVAGAMQGGAGSPMNTDGYRLDGALVPFVPSRQLIVCQADAGCASISSLTVYKGAGRALRGCPRPL